MYVCVLSYIISKNKSPYFFKTQIYYTILTKLKPSFKSHLKVSKTPYFSRIPSTSGTETEVLLYRNSVTSTLGQIKKISLLNHFHGYLVNDYLSVGELMFN